MRALLFGVDPDAPPPRGDSEVVRRLGDAPAALREIPDPGLRGDDWVLVRPRLTGVCGSDVKQFLLDGDADNPLTALVSFPHVPGHEIVGDVAAAGRAAGLAPGDRVALDPWLSCAPRGVDPPCPACAAGDRQLCHDLAEGGFPPGMHLGTCAELPGGFAEIVAAHASMCHPVPAAVPDEVAVLADPVAVGLHAVVRNPPPRGGRVVVYGIGSLGGAILALLRGLFPDVEAAAVVRFPHQADLAAALGARPVGADPREVLDAVTRWTGGRLREPFDGLPWLHGGGVDAVYDTVGSAETLEVGVRALRARGSLVLIGVSRPARFEWTPWYFKELRLAGSNGYGDEDVDGRRAHAIDHVLDLAASGRVDVTGLLTHTFPLERWFEAFAAAADPASSGAVKVAVAPSAEGRG